MASDQDVNQPVTSGDFNAFVQRFETFEERVDRILLKMEADSEAAEKKRNAIEEERANVWKKWDEGKMVEFLQLFFKVNQGNDELKWVRHVKVE